MIESKRVLAIVTARGGSKGLPGKNIREFCGKPLLAWSIQHGLACNYVDRVLVSTDSEEIAAVGHQYGASVPFLRSASLAGDGASSVDVIIHAVDYLAAAGEQYDIIVLLEPTSPLRDVSDISGALELLVTDPAIGSVVGVTKAEAGHPSFLFVEKHGLLTPFSGEQPVGLRRQDLRQEYYYLEGSVYASSVAALRANRGFYHASTAPWVVERYKAIEIDELSDFIAAEALMNAKIEGILK